jgi:hypothetical protein
MAKYKVVEDVEIAGKQETAGSEIELEESVAAPFVEGGELEEVDEEESE